MNAKTFRLEILRILNDAWDLYPSQRQYVDANDVQKAVFKKRGELSDSGVIEGTWDSLREEEFIELAAGVGSPAVRITSNGRAYLERLRDNSRTKLIAYVGAVTGSLGLVISALNLIIGATR